MHKVTVSDGRIFYAEDGEFLDRVLKENSFSLEHPCGGKGTCKKCSVLVNGEKVLSCQYEIKNDIWVENIVYTPILTADAGVETGKLTEKMCLCLDIGTTTIALALVALEDGRIVKSVTRNNPQRAFGADVMNRIDYASKKGTEGLKSVLIDEINCMIEEVTTRKIPMLYVAGNTTMLHLFFGVDPSKMGYAPYTPEFLGEKKMLCEKLGIKNVEEVMSLSGISAFVGADIVAGLNFAGMPNEGKYNLLIDLGTNAEVVVYSKEKLFCTAAAAGPCFEGVNISCGMSATEGAIYAFDGECKVVGNVEPKGVCATGLIDSIAEIIRGDVIDETGYMECNEYEIANGVTLTQKDVRAFQLAKSAVYSAVISLMKKAEITFEDIEKAFVAGGFSSKMNVKNAIKTGLLPKEIEEKIYPINNSCLQGLVKYAFEKNDLEKFLKNAEYVDLALDEDFQDLFIENMEF